MTRLISIIVPSCERLEPLGRLLRCLDRQVLDDGCAFEVIVALDGWLDQGGVEPGLPDAGSLNVTFLKLTRVGISTAKNAAVAASRGDVLLFVNDDVEPAVDLVQQHAGAQSDGHLVVLGASPWVSYSDQTLFDEMIARTRMVFFYGDLVDGQHYDFRHAWNLNLSVARSRLDALDGPFSEALRPIYSDDIEMAHRLVGRDKAVYYHARAVAGHRHRYTLAGYFLRESLAGAMAVSLYEVNPACFAAIHGAGLEELVATARAGVEIDQRDGGRALAMLVETASQPRGCSVDPRLIEALYTAHLPLKRRAFRLGLLARVADSQRAWTELPSLGEAALVGDAVFGGLFDDRLEGPRADGRTVAPSGP